MFCIVTCSTPSTIAVELFGAEHSPNGPVLMMESTHGSAHSRWSGMDRSRARKGDTACEGWHWVSVSAHPSPHWWLVITAMQWNGGIFVRFDRSVITLHFPEVCSFGIIPTWLICHSPLSLTRPMILLHMISFSKCLFIIILLYCTHTSHQTDYHMLPRQDGCK